ncbi:MAG TPA: VWA domain-containing protein [Vicinamibacterales bacterium]|nr:VWA domain-containing protein [Vicinamibacterales bacterium]
MMRRVLVGMLIGPMAIVLAQQQAPVFRGGTDVVALDVTVQDGRTPVLGLKPSDFEVRDNGVPQVVTDVTYGRLPIDLRLVFDTSGSISEDQLQGYLRAMTQVAGALQSDDRCDIIAFSARVVEVAAQQHPPVKIDLHRAEPNATSFFDAVSLALITAPVPGRRQLTIVMSDGIDNASLFDQGMLADMAKRTDAVVYAISPAAQMPRPTVEKEKMTKDRLGLLASTTGGRIITADRDVAPAFLNALDEFRRSYVVVYTATGVKREGWHHVAIAVRGSTKYTVRARQGYMGTGLFSTASVPRVPEVAGVPTRRPPAP